MLCPPRGAERGRRDEGAGGGGAGGEHAALLSRSLGVVLSRGHGEHILLGNTSVEEGGLTPGPGGEFRGQNGFSWDPGRAELV